MWTLEQDGLDSNQALLLICYMTMGQVAYPLSASVFSSKVRIVAIITVLSPRMVVGIKGNVTSKVLRTQPGTVHTH